MNILLVDDEPLALRSLQHLIMKKAGEGWKVTGEFTNPFQALLQAETERYDLAFIDIDMPGMNGLMLADKLLSQQPRLLLVFVTAYQQYAVEAFELHALDYLLKPVQPERLEKTLTRSRQQWLQRHRAGVEGGIVVCCMDKSSVWKDCCRARSFTGGRRR